MALKNTYIEKAAGFYIEKTQAALIKAGASSIQSGFEDGRMVSLTFAIDLKGKEIKFRLPINWRNFQKVLQKEDVKRWQDDDYAYRVAWACTKDWIEAQMAFVESENVSLPQVFLPYAIVEGGQTLFEKVAANPQFLLGNGN